MQTNPTTRKAHHNVTLRTFVNVAEMGSFTDVAKRMNNSQPNVTHHIRKLEEYLGGRVLSRNQSGSAKLTTFGEKAYGICKQIYALEDQLETLRMSGVPVDQNQQCEQSSTKRVMINKIKAILDEMLEELAGGAA